MNEGIHVKDMPKLESPFEREEINGKYVCVPKIRDEYRWIFTNEALAVEKLDGTNVSLIIENKKIKEIFNRQNPIEIFKKGTKRFIESIYESMEKGIFDLSKLADGQYFGELVGPQVNANPYNLENHVWLSFDYLKDNCYFKFWDNFVQELQNLNAESIVDDEEIFKKLSDCFKGLWSLYKRRRGIKGEAVGENTKFEGMAAEGIVFYRKDVEIKFPYIENNVCKLRRDMFDWFKGQQHGL